MTIIYTIEYCSSITIYLYDQGIVILSFVAVFVGHHVYICVCFVYIFVRTFIRIDSLDCLLTTTFTLITQASSCRSRNGRFLTRNTKTHFFIWHQFRITPIHDVFYVFYNILSYFFFKKIWWINFSLRYSLSVFANGRLNTFWSYNRVYLIFWCVLSHIKDTTANGASSRNAT